ncbi:hypothetical protein SO802_027008 [Lithocarpus litseifolius]|uniref:Hexosyltransferase n=1 Tax=Lithocarpus litseifolius TaxID=425828 RepID=A0AAW2C2V4_9ROSI
MGSPPPLYFNAGMFVYEPKLSTYHDLLETVKVTPPALFAEQGSKPWRYTGKEENMQREDIKILIKRWWDIYEDESLDYKNVIAVSKAQPVFEALQLEEIDVVDNRDAPSAA